MLNTTSTFPSELGAGTPAGPDHGIAAPRGFAEAQARYREEQLTAWRADRAARAMAAHRPDGSFGADPNRRPLSWANLRTGMTRWTAWPSSAPRRRSSAACPNSAGSPS
jgi:hypothetical protein